MPPNSHYLIITASLVKVLFIQIQIRYNVFETEEYPARKKVNPSFLLFLY